MIAAGSLWRSWHMKNIEEKQLYTETSGDKPSATGLLGRQSVRATFRLSEACIDAISILLNQFFHTAYMPFDTFEPVDYFFGCFIICHDGCPLSPPRGVGVSD